MELVKTAFEGGFYKFNKGNGWLKMIKLTLILFKKL